MAIRLLVPVDVEVFWIWNYYRKSISNIHSSMENQYGFLSTSCIFRLYKKNVDFFSCAYHETQDRMTDIYIFEVKSTSVSSICDKYLGLVFSSSTSHKRFAAKLVICK